jgi:ABC-type transport system involved in cytochrome bd biosynthesis fused ATPase/permease subunit
MCLSITTVAPSCAQKDACAGRTLALVSDDVSRVSNFFLSVHDLISLPLQIAAALFLLYQQVQVAAAAGLIIAVALIPLNRLLAAAVGRASARMLQHKDARLSTVTAFLASIRSIFMLGWQDVIFEQACFPSIPDECTLVQPNLYLSCRIGGK